MASSILKGIGVIKSVSPKVKSKGISKSKGNISKNVGQARKYQEEREEIMEENLKWVVKLKKVEKDFQI